MWSSISPPGTVTAASLAALLLLPGGGCLADGRADEGRQEAHAARQGSSPYAGDARFDRPIRLEAHAYTGDDLANRIARATGAEVRLEGQLRTRKVSVVADDRPAREVMDGLALVWHAGWQKVQATYVLVTDPRMAAASLLSEEDRIQRTGEAFNALLDSLTPEQEATLNASGALPFDANHTTPNQRDTLRELGPVTYGVPWNWRPTIETLDGGGFSLRISRFRDHHELSLCVQLRNGRGPGLPLVSKPLPPP